MIKRKIRHFSKEKPFFQQTHNAVLFIAHTLIQKIFKIILFFQLGDCFRAFDAIVAT